jgi:hypothetical protein
LANWIAMRDPMPPYVPVKRRPDDAHEVVEMVVVADRTSQQVRAEFNMLR